MENNKSNESNQTNIKKYFKNNINIDLEELKPNYWFFIPQKTRKGKKWQHQY
jgi:hypothetical protein